MEFALQRITNCINNKSTELILSNLNLDYLPNNLPSSLQTLYCSHNQIKELNNLPSSLQTLSCSNNQYLHITKSITTRFNLKETPNYDEMARKIQRIYKYKKRQKRRKFCEELEHHAMEFRLRPMYPEYFVIKNKYKNIFSDC